MISNQGEVAVSIIVPAHNEEESLPHLHQQITTAMAPLGVQWQVVYVDDGSSDRTFQILEAIAQRDPHATVVQLRRNFGQTAAIAAGIDHSSGEVIILVDADLQNDPADIPRLLAKLGEGYDIVSGWRKNRADPWWSRRLPSMVANAIISRVTGVRLHDYGCTLKAYRREVLQDIELYGEMHRLIPALAASIGARISEIEVHHRGRRFGKSKYGIGRTLKVVLDLVTIKFLHSYLTRPMHVLGTIGLGAMGLGVLSLLVTVWMKYVGHGPFLTGNPLLYFSGLLEVIGVQFISMGLIGELVTRTYFESQGKKSYAVRSTLNLKPAAPRKAA